MSGRERVLSGRSRRTSNRAPRFDYGNPGWYFVTVVTEGRTCLFGMVEEGEMRLTTAGEFVAAEWERTPSLRPNVSLDAFVIMPNHIHGIIQIRSAAVRPQRLDQTSLQSPSQTLGAIVRGFKGATTKQVNEAAGTFGQPLWQRNFHDRILNSIAELHDARSYIDANPRHWSSDEHFVDEPDLRAML